MLFRRRASMSPAARAALAELLRAPTFELIPLKTSMDQAAHLPPGATVSVTASLGSAHLLLLAHSSPFLLCRAVRHF